METFSLEKIIQKIEKKHKDKRILILAPLVRGRKGNYKQFFIDLMKKGFLKVRVDGEIKNILDDSYLSVNSLELDRNKVMILNYLLMTY